MAVESKLAASVAPVVGRRVLWGRRTETAAFLPGFHVLPGGVSHSSDARAQHAGGSQPQLRVTALRELFEETGILVADRELDASSQLELRDTFRVDAAEGAERFRSLGLRWRTDALVPNGRWVTPRIAERRFDTAFFLLPLEHIVAADPALDELDELEWVDAEEALSRWGRARVLMAPPLAALLRALRDGRPERAGEVPGADGVESQRWEVVPDLAPLPVRTPTLPPATHTNTFLVGRGRAILVEPATPYPDELDRMVRWIDEARNLGVTPIAIIATHHHRDHIGGARALKERLSLPLWAHAETARRLEVPVERLLEDGERIELDDQVVRMLHTPGHAPGHLCILDERSGALIAGDMVAGVGTILVEPNDGDMALYLESLERMLTVEPTVLLPAHGNPLRSPTAVVEHYVAHRLERERRVLEALRALGPASPSDLLPSAYDDVPRPAWPLAALSTEAHLVKLLREGRARRTGDRWEAT